MSVDSFKVYFSLVYWSRFYFTIILSSFLCTFKCQSFKVKRGEICKIPGCSVSPIPGSPTPVRLPHFQGETFRQFITYVYTGKVRGYNFCILTMVSAPHILRKKGFKRGWSHKFWTFKHLWRTFLGAKMWEGEKKVFVLWKRNLLPIFLCRGDE